LSSWRFARSSRLPSALVPVSLRHPVADRLCRRVKLPRQLVGDRHAGTLVASSACLASWTPSTQILGWPGDRVDFSPSTKSVMAWRKISSAMSLGQSLRPAPPGRDQDLASKRATNRAWSSRVRARREDRATACRWRARMHWRWRQPSVPAMPRRILEIFRLVG
jgi:hypothetical protein